MVLLDRYILESEILVHQYAISVLYLRRPGAVLNLRKLELYGKRGNGPNSFEKEEVQDEQFAGWR